MRALSLLTPPLCLWAAACAVEPLPRTEPARPVPPPPAAVAECKAEPAQRLVGQRAQPSTPEAARIATGSRIVRVVKPGQAVTMDFRSDRLTMTLDANGVVTRLSCG